MLLEQAKRLEGEVRDSLSSRDFISDDIRMDRYNQILREARASYPDDRELTRMAEMPDRLLQWVSVSKDPAMPSKRLLERLTQLVDRLELLEGPTNANQSEGIPDTEPQRDQIGFLKPR